MRETLEKNKALARRFLEELSKGNLDVIDELLSPDFVDRSLLPGQGPTREDFKRTNKEFLDALSTISFTIVEQIAEGDTVVTKYRNRFVSRGELAGLPPTGKEETVEGIYIHRIARGKITEEWSTLDVVPLWEDLTQEIRERARVEQEMRVARSIQQAALPREVPHLEGWQISPYYQPAREVGGDFYEFFELDDGRVGFAVGDATGKGVPAAFVMSATCALLGGVATAPGASPGEVLERVNETVLARIPPNMFVTCFYAILEPESGRLVYANAGHNLPCCSRRHDGQVDELRARGMPLGLMREMRYEEEEAVLVPGESVLLYSDGLIEAHDPNGEMFGTPRLHNLLTDYPPDAQTLNALLLEELTRFTGAGWEQEDDITLLTLRRFASP